MKTYRIDIAGMKRDLPLCPISDSLYIAGFVIIGDQELTVHTAKELLKLAPKYDYILTAETKGIPLVHEMSRQNGDKKYLVARKGVKLYMVNPVSVPVQSITTKGEQRLYLDGEDVKLIRGKKVLIVDDVISTGRSLEALECLADRCGASIVGRMSILAEGEAATRDDIIFLQKLPLFDKDCKPLPVIK